MIRWESKLEANADDLVRLMDATVRLLADRAGSKPAETTKAILREVIQRRQQESEATVAPDAPWVNGKHSVPDSGAPTLDRATEEQLAEGADLWMGLLTTWQQGFGEEGVEQPDRLGLLAQAVTQGGGRMFAALHHYGGLTRLVRSLMAHMPKKKARRLAEHIAQVSSAAGIPVISEALEYDPEYLGEEYRND